MAYGKALSSDLHQRRFLSATVEPKRLERRQMQKHSGQGGMPAQVQGASMMKSAYVIAAMLIAAAIVGLPNLSLQVQASAPAAGAKADRLDARPLGSACSQREWPYFGAGCLWDTKYPHGIARPVRMVSTDRLPPLPAEATPQ
jgi:hypothetical protein